MTDDPRPAITPRTYTGEFLDENFGDIDPMVRFSQWFDHATEHNTLEPDAFVLATFDGENVNARTVALRGTTENGFLIYTNYHSQKAREMDAHPQVSMVFYFAEVSRQIRIKGTAAKTSEEQSDRYFASRPRGSQVGAWASRQSEMLASRDELNAVYAQCDNELGEIISRPPFWGGYEIVPFEFEFMQGHENRLHDRFRFRRDSQTDHYLSERLWP